MIGGADELVGTARKRFRLRRRTPSETRLRREPFRGDAAGKQVHFLAPKIKSTNLMTVLIFDNAARDYVLQNNVYDTLKLLQPPGRAPMTL